MKKEFVKPKFYTFTPDQEKRAFNLILKNTIGKKIEWEQGSISEIFRGDGRESRILLYYGEKQIGLSIQNKSQYVFFVINKEQAQILRDLIRGKSTLKITQELKLIESNDDYYMSEVDYE